MERVMHGSDVKKAVIAANFFERSKFRLNDHNRGVETPIPQKKNITNDLNAFCHDVAFIVFGFNKIKGMKDIFFKKTKQILQI